MDSRRKLRVRLDVVAAMAVVIAALVLIPLACGKGWPFMKGKSAAPVFDIPKLDGITIDGKADDWGDRGFQGTLIGVRRNRLMGRDDLGVTFRVGWNQSGLLFLLNVRGDYFAEASSADALWGRSCVEMFVADSLGGANLVQTVVSPGITADQPEMRTRIYDGNRPAGLREKVPARVEAARTKADGGYVLEALLPWDMIEVVPERGREVAFQFYVGDVDQENMLGRAMWYPVHGAHADSRLMQRLRLAERPGGYRPTFAVTTELADRTQLRWSFACEKRYSGESIIVRRGQRVMARAVLKAEGDIATATCLATREHYAEPAGPAEIVVDNPAGPPFVSTASIDAIPAFGFELPTPTPEGEVFLPGLHAPGKLRGSMLGHLLACAKYLGYSQSDAWLAGATGLAFALNVRPDLCPSGPSAWNDADRPLPLASNAGLRVNRLHGGTREQADFARSQKDAFKLVQDAINAGKPVAGQDMATPEVYLVSGYDSQGNYLYLEPSDGARKKCHHTKPGSVFFIFPELTVPADDRATVTAALSTALALADGREFNQETCGLRAYDNWIAGLAEAGAGNSGFGAAYNAACWSDCRQLVVPFLREARKRLHDRKLNRHFDAAIKQYGIVAKKLAEVSSAFPLTFGDEAGMKKRFADDGLRRQAQEALREAKAAEEEGVKALRALLDAMGKEPDTNRPADDMVDRTVRASEQILAEFGNDGPGDADGYLTEVLISAKVLGWDKLTYHELCAVSGSSALFGYDPSTWRTKYANRGIGMDRRIAEATGYTMEWVKWKDLEDAWRILKESIDSGRPVMSEYYEMCTWVAYREDDIAAKRWAYMIPGPGPGDAGWKTWVEFVEWFREWGHFAGAWGRYSTRTEPAPEQDVARRVIRDLVAWSAERPAGAPPAGKDKTVFGLAGIRAYAADILDFPGKKADYWNSTWRGCHAVQPQRGFRYSTAVYLESLVERKMLDTAATKEVAAAAAEYRLAYEQWKRWNEQLGRAAAGAGAWGNAEHRRAGGKALLKAAEHEEKALGYLKAVVEQGTRQGGGRS